MIVATTRPETMLGDTAVAVHSRRPAMELGHRQTRQTPLTDRLIPIIADDILVDPKFGTGVVKVTPAHDPNDYAVWQRHQGKPDQIDLINILNPDGTINANAGQYAGMKRDAARKKVVEDLTAAGPARKRRALRNPGRPQRPQQDAGRAVSERSMVREDGPAGRAGAGSRARWDDQILPRTPCAAVSESGSARSAIGRSRGSFGGGIGFRCGTKPMECPASGILERRKPDGNREWLELLEEFRVLRCCKLT